MDREDIWRGQSEKGRGMYMEIGERWLDMDDIGRGEREGNRGGRGSSEDRMGRQ